MTLCYSDTNNIRVLNTECHIEKRTDALGKESHNSQAKSVASVKLTYAVTVPVLGGSRVRSKGNHPNGQEVQGTASLQGALGKRQKIGRECAWSCGSERFKRVLLQDVSVLKTGSNGFCHITSLGRVLCGLGGSKF